jgi:hypothetical protein
MLGKKQYSSVCTVKGQSYRRVSFTEAIYRGYIPTQLNFRLRGNLSILRNHT